MTSATTITLPLVDALFDDLRDYLADDHVSLCLSQGAGGSVHVEEIWSERERGAGRASRVLDALCAAADRQGVALTLVCHWLAYDLENGGYDDAEADRLHDLNEARLDNAQLAAWYARRGFVETDREDWENPRMRREPAARS